MVALTLPLLLFSGLVAGGFAQQQQAEQRSAGKSRRVETFIHASWPQSCLSPLAEVAEYLAEGEAGAYWRYLESLNEQADHILDLCANRTTSGEADVSENDGYESGPKGAAASRLQVTAVAAKAAEEAAALDSLQMRLLQLAISSRTYVITVEAHRRVASMTAGVCGHEHGPDGTPWVIMLPAGIVACDAAALDCVLNEQCTDADAPEGKGGRPHIVELKGDDLRSIQQPVFAQEHVYSSSSPGVHSAVEDKVAVLYGALSTRPMMSMHELLVKAVNERKLAQYRFRHALPYSSLAAGEAVSLQSPSVACGSEESAAAQWTDGVRLQGYGVFLDIKDMEYKAINADIDAAAAGDDDAADLEEAVGAGQDAGQEFKLEDAVLDDEGQLQITALANLGLQSTLAISGSADPLSSLEELCQNFPSHAARVSKLKVPPLLKTEARILRQYFGRSRSMGGGDGQVSESTLYLNGLPVRLDSYQLNVFELMSSIRRERSQLKKVSDIHLPPDAMRDLQNILEGTSDLAGQATAVDSAAGLRIDVLRNPLTKQGGIVWLNNIEKDAAYSSWRQTSLMGLFRSMGFGGGGGASLSQIRRNWAHVVLYGDPTTEETAAAVNVLMGLVMDRQLPARIGLIFASKEDTAQVSAGEWVADGGPAAVFSSTAFASARHVAELTAMAKASEVGSAEHVSRFLMSVSDAVLSKAPLTLELLAQLYGEAAMDSTSDIPQQEHAAKALEAISNNSSLGQPSALVMAQLAAETGLPVDGCWMVNGLINTAVGSLKNELVQVLIQEQMVIAQMLMEGFITDNTRGIYSRLLSHPATEYFNRYHPMLSSSPSTMQLQLFNGMEAGEWVQGLSWLHPPETEESMKALSFLIVLDPTTVLGRAAMEQALTFLIRSAGEESKDDSSATGVESKAKYSKDVRMSFCLNPKESFLHSREDEGRERPERDMVLRLIYLTQELQRLGRRGVLPLLLAVVERVNAGHSLSAEDVKRLAIDAAGMTANAAAKMAAVWDTALTAEASGKMDASFSSITRILGLEAGQQEVILNGRRSPIDGRAMVLSDFSLMVDLHAPLGSYMSSVAESWDWSSMPNVSPDDVTADFRSSSAMRLSAFLLNYHRKARTPILAEIQRAYELYDTYTSESDSASAASSRSCLISSHPHVPPTPTGGKKDGDGSSEGGSLLNVVAVLDPLSLAAQRVATLLRVIAQELELPVTVILLPSLRVAELPLQNYYRFVLGTRSAHLQDVATVDRLPTQHILTQRLDTPEAWNVQQLRALQDSDNLRCDSSVCGDHGSKVSVIAYKLKDVLVSGQCFARSATGGLSPPTTLQLQLSSAGHNTAIADTVVMKIFGYFQIKADPGVWRLGLAPGPGTEIYQLYQDAAADGDDGHDAVNGHNLLTTPGDEKEACMHREVTKLIAVDSFNSRVEKLYVEKRRGMEHLDLLQAVAEMDDHGEQRDSAEGAAMGTGIFNSLRRALGGGSDAQLEVTPSGFNSTSSARKDDVVHIFSLATGHLYERFLKIMMLSAHKRTSAPVKFWLLENYLSPSFKKSAQIMSEAYGFEVAYVTYKWPEWLLPQSEKQRIIWGYKILFLDVLFPIDLKKVIYVDADQVVRGDLKELWDMDLQGKPYAYTPFCSSREETLGFQFWRGGFWEQHLNGKPYHISALYVVDLVQFRRLSVGDTLRAVYDGLARDPNSLSNLDQDLPNYAQHQVPIFSLPQEWLWCESWCSDDTKKSAKTIDLCNNPQHKEPKLDMAKRIISGPLFNESWLELDAEVKSLEKEGG